MKKFLYRTLCGFFLGMSIFAPGFSGSLVAIAMGIYHEAVRIISNPFKQLKKNLMFITPVGTGMVISAVLFVIAFRQLFDSYEKAMYLLFAGLIAGSVPIVFMEVKKAGFKPYYLIGAFLACIAAVAIGVFASETGLMSGDTASMSDWPGLIIGGFVAGVTAWIPGMSLSTVLIILGVFSPLIYSAEALLRGDLSYIIPIGLFLVFVLVGLMSTAKGIKIVFEKIPGFANTTVLGFILGSFISIAYQSHQISDEGFTWLIGGVMLAVGFAVSVSFLLLSRVINKGD